MNEREEETPADDSRHAKAFEISRKDPLDALTEALRVETIKIMKEAEEELEKRN